MARGRRSIFQAFRSWGSLTVSNTLQLYGLHASTKYIISDYLESRPQEEHADSDTVIRTWASLMEHGLEVLIEGQPGATMLLITAVHVEVQQ